jgi:DNA-binding FadR family transcriptional regulator
MECERNFTESDNQERLQSSFIAPMNSQSIVDQIIFRITNAIENGELQPGQRIPTEAELCENLKVGRNSIREAIKALVAMGVLNIRRAEGTFIAEGFSDRMMDPMIYGLILEGGNSPYVIELRRLFDVGTLKLAIEKATPQNIEDMKKALQDLQKAIQNKRNAQAILAMDVRFHKAFRDAIHNPLVNRISDVIDRLTSHSREMTVRHLFENNKLDILYDMHRKMLDIVISKDETAVAGVVDEHFVYWKDALR